ncbi:serine protease Do [Paenibacillus cellulosilyticus]|uniref:Serine protease Do n=1 Tax=Paenibacillus cellulosilyticus TaxID=375489 RepID=A0A2V2Z4S9_9BACL|nr:trypsin-like peptidase domain-containing protein [Paenibacillus cellulosilyticus]PWW08800.1 serine protease Do [Paenibacillus cellulosilyticus]QKS48352.1 trypsin-like peptidase domain-containing protein [Paenibacillus cellulosilyticus]
MSLFDDDFYSSRVSRRKSRWLQEDARQSKVLRSKSNWSTMRVAVLSSTISAAAAALIFGTLFYHGGGSSDKAVPTASAVTATQTADPYEKTITAAAKVRPMVVSVINEQYGVSGFDGSLDSDSGAMEDQLQQAGIGSGVIFEKEDGKALVVTNYHVIAGAERVQVAMIDGTSRVATIVGSDQITDLAVLQIDDDGIGEVAEFGDSSKLRNGEWVMAIGSPLGLDDSLTMGIISKTTRVIPVSLNQDGNYDWEQEVIQIDASINQGNSGGPLIDLDGHVVGINSMKIADLGVEGVGFAIPIDNAKPVIDSLIKYGVVKRPYLGVYTLDLDQYLAQQALTKPKDSLDSPQTGVDGSIVVPDSSNGGDAETSDAVIDDSGIIIPDDVKDGVIVLEAVGPAQEAGLQFNDLIVKLDKTPIGSTMELRKYLYDHKKIGDSIEITYYRDGEKQTAKLKLSEKSKDDD